MARFFHTLAVTTLLAAAGVALDTNPSLAAEPESSLQRYRFTSPIKFHRPVVPYPTGCGYVHSHSSTAAEGYLRGKAAVIDALGNFRLADSQSAILFEQARALDRENDLRQTQALHAQQAMWREARDAERDYNEKRSAEGRAKLASRKAIVHRAAYRLSPAEFDETTGQLNWPKALTASKFGADRERLQECCRRYVGYGERDAATAAEIARLTKQLRHALRSEIGVVEPADYMAAQKFLIALSLQVNELQG